MTGSMGDPGPREQDSPQTLSPAFLGHEVVGQGGVPGPSVGCFPRCISSGPLSGKILLFAYTGQLAWTLLI